MKTKYRIHFNGVTTEHLFDYDDEAFRHAERLTDTAALPTVEKYMNDCWHWWHNQREEWHPAGMTKVRFTVDVEGWMPNNPTYPKNEPTEAAITVPGYCNLVGVTLTVDRSSLVITV